MKLYYCGECKQIFNEDEIIQGETYAVDNYRNDECPDCHEDLLEISEDDICGVCEGFHDEEDSDLELVHCFNKVYTDQRGTLYIMKHWKAAEIYEIMAELSDSGSDEPLKTTIWTSLYENGDVKKFIRFVCEFDDARTSERRDWDFIRELVKVQDGDIYELIDTGDPLKAAV